MLHTRRLGHDVALYLSALLLLSGCEKETAAPDQPPEKPGAPAAAFKLSGPYIHENLAIFLVHGADKLQGKTYLTLQEGLEQKKVVVHETENVSQLTIENLSDTDEIYVQSGDIVKGGKQDRVIAVDFIVPKTSGKMPIASFCVESGRWHQRGGEAFNAFNNSSFQLSSNNGRVAAKLAIVAGRDETLRRQTQLATEGQQLQPQAAQTEGAASQEQSRPRSGQSAVWDEVAKSQGKLSSNVGQNVQSFVSPSSMQLSLENPKVQEASQKYVDALGKAAAGKDDLIGFVYALNGKLINADVYASPALFAKLWPKLLKSAAIEAVAELQKDKKFDAPTAEAVQAWLAGAEKGKLVEQEVSKRVKLLSRQSYECYKFQTVDEKVGAPVHDNWAAKQ